MDKHEWELLDKLLSAAYDGTPVTIHRSKNGKIVDVEVHDKSAEGEADER